MIEMTPRVGSFLTGWLIPIRITWVFCFLPASPVEFSRGKWPEKIQFWKGMMLLG